MLDCNIKNGIIIKYHDLLLYYKILNKIIFKHSDIILFFITKKKKYILNLEIKSVNIFFKIIKMLLFISEYINLDYCWDKCISILIFYRKKCSLKKYYYTYANNIKNKIILELQFNLDFIKEQLLSEKNYPIIEMEIKFFINVFLFYIINKNVKGEDIKVSLIRKKSILNLNYNDNILDLVSNNLSEEEKIFFQNEWNKTCGNIKTLDMLHNNINIITSEEDLNEFTWIKEKEINDFTVIDYFENRGYIILEKKFDWISQSIQLLNSFYNLPEDVLYVGKDGSQCDDISVLTSGVKLELFYKVDKNNKYKKNMKISFNKIKKC